MAKQSPTSVLVEPGVMESGGEINEEKRQAACVEQGKEKMYVAVGKDVKESKSVLMWALQHSDGYKICLLHVHQPAHMIPMMGGKFPAIVLDEQEVRAYRDFEKKKMHKILSEYLTICSKLGVEAEKVEIDMDNIEKGIIQLILQHRVKRLVMGAAAYKHYTKKMAMLKSKKALFVNQQADASCHIWFVCNGCLICTREQGRPEGTELMVAVSFSETTQRSCVKSRSLSEGRNDQRKPSMLQAFSRRVRSHGGKVQTLSSPQERGGRLMLQSQLGSEGSDNGGHGVSRRSLSMCSTNSTCSSNEVLESSESISLVTVDTSDDEAPLSSIHELEEDPHLSSPVLEEVSDHDETLDQLQQALAEAENSRREAFEESIRRQKSEIDSFEATQKAKAAERLYANEVRQRKKAEEALAREKVKQNKIKGQLDELTNKLRTALDQKSVLEIQISDSEQAVKELEEKIISAVELLITYKEEKDGLMLEHDNAVREADELRKRNEELTTSSQSLQSTSEFSFLEIEEVTRSFDPSLIIGEGGYGSVYRGFLCHTEVAIKFPHATSSHGHSEFQQEVDVLSRMRHPNLVTLIGACPEAQSLIYEYLPNGSLEDRLSCKDSTPPLSWQKRICIALEICSALIFLHSNKPHSLIHGDIKPANILLDANFVSKLGDFGMCRLASNSINTTTPCCITSPKGTFVYMDPEFLATGELSVKSDVYAFGIILLRLLTGRPALGLVKEVQYALEKGNLSRVLDVTAGDWPFVQAKQLAHLALRCCEINRKNRPYLDSEVWRVLVLMKASCGASSSFHLGAEEENCGVPSYFICPIFQEIMRDPHVAADGFTYESEALKAWLDSGHNTSPMTNLELAHCDLIPNHSLRSAIEEWLQTR